MKSLLLFTLFANQMLFMSILNVTPEISHAKHIMLSITILSIFFAPLQAGLSDSYCRKKSLIIALLITLISTTFFLFWLHFKTVFFLPLYIIFIGIAGNVTPIILSAFKDIIKIFYNFRLIISLWILTFYFGENFPSIFRGYIAKEIILSSSIIFSIISLFLIIFLFKDVRDKTLLPKISIKQQAIYIYHNFLKNISFLLSILGYFIAIISLYQITFRSEVLHNLLVKNIPLEFITGTFLGVIFYIFYTKEDLKAFKFGFTLSLISINLLFFLTCLNIKNNFLLIMLMIIYSFGLCIFISSLYCMLTRARHHHDYGKIYGILESVDSLGYFFAALIIFSLKDINLNYIWCISSILLILSGIFFHFFIKKEKNIKIS